MATLRAAVLISFFLVTTNAVIAQISTQFPGGWIERQGTFTRARYTASHIHSFIPPSRGAFTFPPPYNTNAVRLTDASDCGGADCVNHVGYSYWRNTNAHEQSNDMWIFLGLSKAKGGSGPTLFRLDKTTDAVTKVGPLFPAGSTFAGNSAEGWYFSAGRPNILYVNDGPKMLRYDVVSKEFETVFDITSRFGDNRDVWQMHSSNDDLVHSATLRNSRTKEYLGCLVYRETTGKFSFFPKQGTFDECHLDKSGDFLAIFDQIDDNPKMDDVFVDLRTGEKKTVYNGMGHHDLGYGYIIGGDGRNALPNAIITYLFTPTFFTAGPVDFYNVDWKTVATNHLSHLNAKAGVPMTRQFACGSNVDRGPAQNEVLCFRLDGSRDQLVVAPIMTCMDAPGGGTDYAKYPKGNLDISGKYFIWTSNLCGSRLDAFLVKVPSHLLVE